MPRRLRITPFRFGGEDLAVLSFPLDEVALPASLTTAEREVARALLEGDSNAQIAKARGRSERTVANQVAALFRKIGVGSRAELLLALARARRS